MVACSMQYSVAYTKEVLLCMVKCKLLIFSELCSLVNLRNPELLFRYFKKSINSSSAPSQSIRMSSLYYLYLFILSLRHMGYYEGHVEQALPIFHQPSHRGRCYSPYSCPRSLKVPARIILHIVVLTHNKLYHF